jgi:hypothetical protein
LKHGPDLISDCYFPPKLSVSRARCSLPGNGSHRWTDSQPEALKLLVKVQFTHEDGQPVRHFRGAWDALLVAGKLPGFLFHDLRRSAVRNMIRRGVPQKTVRQISGHKTDSVFSRYNIISENDIADASRKVEEGAKAALKGSIHSSLIAEPSEEAQREQPESKPLYNQWASAVREWRNWQTRKT